MNKLLDLLLLPLNFFIYALHRLVDRITPGDKNRSMSFSVFRKFYRKATSTSEGEEKDQYIYRRYTTAPFRKLPDFIFIGTIKCGSSTLEEHLGPHPQLHPPLADRGTSRGTHYFRIDQNYEHGDYWYRSWYSLKLYNQLFKPHKRHLDFESAATYFTAPEVPGRISSSISKPRFILVLRNPVDRAYSEFHFRTKNSLEKSRGRRNNLDPENKIDFKYALEYELESIPAPKNIKSIADIHALDSRETISSSTTCFRFGLYYVYLKHWLKYFPLDQFLILKSEKLFNQPSESLDRISDFLGIETFKQVSPIQANSGDYPPMSNQTRNYLRELYSPFNNKLYDLIGRDLGWD